MPSSRIVDDPALLTLMRSDATKQRDIYKPGPYWSMKCRNAAIQIMRNGLADFRGASSIIGLSFSDCVYVDYRHTLGVGVRKPLQFLFHAVFPFNHVFDSQVALTRSYEAETRRLRNQIIQQNCRVAEVLGRYVIPPSLLGGCLDYVEIDGRNISTYYIDLLDRHDRVAQECGFSRIRGLLEIGGGFGANVHLLLENHPELRKVVYLDIPPNLYVGTQYLKALYGDSVRDYRRTRELRVIQFAEDDELEIFAIAPWQIERLDVSLDLVYNAHSFVEMPHSVVSNYANWLSRLPGFESTAVVMLTYGSFDGATTLDPELLPRFFPAKTFGRSTFRSLCYNFDTILFSSKQEKKKLQSAV